MEIPKFDEETDFAIRAAAKAGDGFQLEIEAAAVDDADRRAIRAQCDKVLEYVIEGTWGPSFELSDQHPLLWEYKYDSASAYFSGAPSNSLAAIGAIIEAHQAAVGGWFGFTKYLNVNTSLKNLLESGNGLLARGPVPLLEVYKQVLKEHGAEVEIVSPYPHGGRLSDREMQMRLKTESQVLLVGDSYVVGLGWSFSD